MTGSVTAPTSARSQRDTGVLAIDRLQRELQHCLDRLVQRRGRVRLYGELGEGLGGGLLLYVDLRHC